MFLRLKLELLEGWQSGREIGMVVVVDKVVVDKVEVDKTADVVDNLQEADHTPVEVAAAAVVDNQGLHNQGQRQEELYL